MILTGVQIRYIGLFHVITFKTAVDLHNWVGFVLIANYFLWFVFYLTSDKIKVYHPDLSPAKHFTEAFRQLKYYSFGMFMGEHNPHHVSAYHKFNPMQSMFYQIVMLLLVPVQIYTGILLWDVERFQKAVDFLGGVRIVDTVHVLAFIFFVFFICIHPYLATLGHTPTAHIKAMLTGYEEVEDEEQ
jgi:thiosulfate reductase cytochrome b subunit